MALSMPIRPVTLPTAIKGQVNGAVDPHLLRYVQHEQTALIWFMAELPARSMRALHAAAAAEGLHLTSSGRGRSLSQQWTIFGGSSARYKPVSLQDYSAAPTGNRKYWGLADYITPAGQPAPGRASAAKTLGVVIPDSSYWIMIGPPYPAMAAVPGSSNHGFWCADDMAKVDPTGVLPYLSFNAADLQILYRLAPLYGFWWETTKENWHVQWGNGDELTAATIAYENGAPVPPNPNPPVDSKLMITIFELTDAAAVFYGYTFNGVALQVEWTGDGADPAVQDRLRILRQFGANTIKVSAADIGRTTLLGALPNNDPLKNWTSADFAKHIPSA